MTSRLIIAGIIAFLYVIAVPQVYAEPVKNESNGNYYEWSHFPYITWTDAKDRAESSNFYGINGHLVTISDAHENQFVSNMIWERHTSWIGLTDRVTEGTFKWVTNEPLSYTNWDQGEPSGTNCNYCDNNMNSHEDYVLMYGNNGKWNDITNGNLYYGDYYAGNTAAGFIIEYDIPSINPVLNPENGHYYDFIEIPGISWNNANNIIGLLPQYQGLTGHMVTITSQSEQEFINNIIPDNSRPWIGLTDIDSEGTFKWITGERLDYTYWNTNQPDNYNNNEDYVHLVGNESKWNDNKDNYAYSSGFIVEFTSADLDPVLNPDNGNYYQVNTVTEVSWEEANESAEIKTHLGVSGHLVTITTQSENMFVKDLVKDGTRSWIGASDKEREGDFKWVTGEQSQYTNWADNQPNNANNNENYVEFLGTTGTWNDIYTDDLITGYIVEFEIPLHNPENDHFYEFVSSPGIERHEAHNAAQLLEFNGNSGYLTTITNSSENMFVKKLLDQNAIVYIGLSDAIDDGEYSWGTGEGLSHTNWGSNEPFNPDNNDFVVMIEHTGQWHAIDERLKIIVDGYIVEYDP